MEECGSHGIDAPKLDEIQLWLSSLPPAVLAATELDGVLGEVSQRGRLGAKQMLCVVDEIANQIATVSQRLAHLEKHSELSRGGPGSGSCPVRRESSPKMGRMDPPTRPPAKSSFSLRMRAVTPPGRDAGNRADVLSADGHAADFDGDALTQGALDGSAAAFARGGGESGGDVRPSSESGTQEAALDERQIAAAPATPMFELPAETDLEGVAACDVVESLDRAIKEWGAEQIRTAEATLKGWFDYISINSAHTHLWLV